MNTATRTFDCPWCGAITPVPADHLGEHFACPECKKATKLTVKNTSTGDLTEAPPDAPHLTGDRTFDCPWCGAISAVPADHLGARFTCPECKKDTKLTATNTQRAPVTVPPPDAPHVETSYRGAWIGLGVALAAAAGWLLFGPSGSKPEADKPPTETGRTDQAPVGPSTPTVGPAKPAPSTETPTPRSTEVPPKPPGPDVTPAPNGAPAPNAESGAMASTPSPAAMSSTETAPPAEAPVDERVEVVRARAKAEAATAALAQAMQEQVRATQAVEAWKAAHPGAADAARELPVLEQTTMEIVRIQTDKSLVADPTNPKPDEVRAMRAAIAKYIDQSPERVALAERALEAMRRDLGGREVAGIETWKELPFAGDGFRRTAWKLLDAARTLAVPAELTTALGIAQRRVEAASAARDEAERDLKSVVGP